MILPKIILPSKIPGLRHRVAPAAPEAAAAGARAGFAFLQTLYLLETKILL
jgi:hypothetical protein